MSQPQAAYADFEPALSAPSSAPSSATGEPAILDGDAWLRGRTVVHKIVSAIAEPASCLAAMLIELDRTGGTLRRLSVSPDGAGAFEAVLNVDGLHPEEARRLVDRLAPLPQVRSIAIEHVLIA